jgi:hypothetical protein
MDFSGSEHIAMPPKSAPKPFFRDPAFDDYIAQKPGWAQPVLTRLRGLIHTACPEVSEAIKWGHLGFDYKGMLCGLATFKAYVSLGFPKEKLLIENADFAAAIGALGKMASVEALPPDENVLALLCEAARLNAENIKVPASASTVVVPDYFRTALDSNSAAAMAFESFPPGAKKEYITWLEGAKTDATRTKRLAAAIEWISEGKKRHWKHS